MSSLRADVQPSLVIFKTISFRSPFHFIFSAIFHPPPERPRSGVSLESKVGLLPGAVFGPWSHWHLVRSLPAA